MKAGFKGNGTQMAWFDNEEGIYRIMGYFRRSSIFELFEEEVFYEN